MPIGNKLCNIRSRNLLGTKYGLTEILLFMTFFFSSLLVFQIPGRGITYFILFEVALSVWVILKTKRIPVPGIIITLFYCEMLISSILVKSSELPLSYKNGAIYMTILLIPVYFAGLVLELLVRDDIRWAFIIRAALYAVGIVQIIWSIIEYICFRCDFDINKAVFVDFLHTVTVASIGYAESPRPTGFSWHPSSLQPVLVIALFFSDSIWIKIMACFVAVVCGNSTVLIGVTVYFILTGIRRISDSKYKIKRITILLIAAFALLILFSIVSSGFIYVVLDKFNFLIQRVTGGVIDQSAIGHIRYYTAFPRVWRISNISRVLFGYGTGCSGYPISVLYGQYRLMGSWAVECDVMNILYSWGIIGFVLYYSFMIGIMVRGWRINHKYSMLMLIILVGGITYNIQYDWVMLFLMFLNSCITHGIDIFDFTGKNDKVKTDLILGQQVV